MRYSMSGAARVLGLHKTTIHRAIKNGRLSAEKLEDGTYAIDASELARVYGGVDPATGAPARLRDGVRPATATEATPHNSVEPMLIAELRAELTRERETVDDLRRRLDVAEERVTRLLLAIPAPGAAPDMVATPAPAPVPAHRPGFLTRLLGRV